MIGNTQVIYPNENDVYTIGSSFTSDIFYRMDNLISAYEGKLCYQNKLLIYESKDQRRTILEYGDELRIEGLWIMNLSKVILVCAYCGDLRIALRNQRG